MNQTDLLMHGTYDTRLVILSIFIAILAAGAALDLAGRVTSARGTARLAWLSGGAFAMGTGIWAMHYIGMLAFDMGMPMLYDWPTVVLSMLAAIGASFVALFVVSRKTMGLAQAAQGSVFMGSGIAAMHYIGMEAMRMQATTHYDKGLFSLSIVLAIVISFVALWLAFAFRSAQSGWGWKKIGTAVVMGGAIPVMHYVGMAAARFTHTPEMQGSLAHAISINELGTLSITLVTLVILSLVFITSTIDRRFAVQAMALESSENRYRLIVETAFDAFLEIDPEGRITDWNAQAQRTFGWERSEVVGRSVWEMLADEQETKDTEYLRKVFSRQNSEAKEGRLVVTARHCDGHTFPAEMAISAVELGDKTIFAAFVHDVADRKRAEKEREEAKAAAESASRAKSEFLANMSHEIRTPLNGVIGMTDLTLETELSGEQREYLETVKLSADSLLNVINDILDFSKIEAGKIDLEEVEFDLRECVEGALKTLALRADEKGLELLGDVEGIVPETVKGDPGRIRQILINLLGNAIKFTHAGEVTLKVQLEEKTPVGVQLHFIVTDTGIGIARDKLDAIFQSFSQADTSTTREYGGTGLGLTISKRLVEMMNGEIWVESEYGTGSQFHFTLHLAVGRSKQPVSGMTTIRQPLPAVKVLIVDDNRTNRRILEGLLVRWGMLPSVASSGEEALVMMEAAKKSDQPFALVLTDMHMPKMDGFDLVESIQRKPGMSAATIMMLTSGGQRGDAARCEALGIAAYLLKPVRQSELKDAITKVLQENARQEEAPMITRATLEKHQDPARSLSVLLAEDNQVNQMLAVRLLQKRGHRVVVAGNGRQAVEILDRDKFDLVLMDVQMPEMDGLEATRLIRHKEKETGTHQPVVAMTALVMKGDRERCIEAGMDGYLSKPIRQEELDAVLDKYIADLEPEPQASTGGDSSIQQGTVDVPELMERIDNDVTFLAELLEIFKESYPAQIQSLREAALQNDAEGIKRGGHALKSALGNLSAIKASAYATELEAMGGSGEIAGSVEKVNELETEMVHVVETLAGLCQEAVR